MQRLEYWKQIFASEDAIEVPPTICIERLRPGVVVYDSDVVHARERGEVFECFHPKFGVRLVDLRPNCQGR